MIKALPWFTSVREKISDPKYAPWFMNFSDAVIANHNLSHVPVCDDNYDPPLCSNLYHDQSQTQRENLLDEAGSCITLLATTVS